MEWPRGGEGARDRHDWHSAPALGAEVSFSFEGTEVRAVLLDGQSWFVARDVAEALVLIGQTLDFLASPTGNGKAVHANQAVLSEEGIYVLAGKAQRDRRKTFLEWLERTAVPALAKKGAAVVKAERRVEKRKAVAVPPPANIKPAPKKAEGRALAVQEEAPKAPEVATFDFNGAQLRTITIDGLRWFAGSNVLTVLYGTADGQGHRYDKLAADEYRSVPRRHLGLTPGKDAKIVSESGLYKLIMRSDKPQARAFQDWVTRTVLPALRKDGMYVVGEEKVTTGEMGEDELTLSVLERLRSKVDSLKIERDEALAKRLVGRARGLP